MNRTIKHKALRPIAAAAASIAMGSSAWASTWVPTPGGAYNWSDAANWNAAVPDAPGAVADITTDIAGNQTIAINGDRTVGVLNFGDSGTSGAQSVFTISAGSPAGKLIFQGAVAGAPTTINLNGASGLSPSYASNTISAGIKLGGTSALTINQNGLQNFVSGSTDINGNTLTIVGAGTGLVILSSVSGTGDIIKNNSSTWSPNASNTYTGSLTINKGTVKPTSGNIKTFTDVTINGALGTSIVTQNGGILELGDNSGMLDPGQRLPTEGVTLNAGTLYSGGQKLNAPDTAKVVTDSIDALNFNSGYSRLGVSGNDTSGGTTLNVTTLARGDGATASTVSSSLAGTPNSPKTPGKVFVSNISGFLKGAGNSSGTSQSIIPWMTAVNTNASAAVPSDWATYGANGVVALLAADYSTFAAATLGTENVKDASNLAASKTVNSLIASGSMNIGNGNTLTITSGALLLSNNGKYLGQAGNAAAGTIDFGSAEGVVWVIGSNSNPIGSVIDGSGGLTKAGTGTLTIQGANTYTGDTFVSAGTLRVGDGTYSSVLGDGDVSVANGATLQISSVDIIPDTSVLRLDQYGLFNGKASMDTGINETVGGLYLGGVAQIAGTYGSTLSSATFQNDTYFSGSGILTVVPEPGSLGLLALAGLLGMRRRRQSA